MTQPVTLSVARVDRAKALVRQKIEELITMPADTGLFQRAEINGQLFVLSSLSLINAAEARALAELADLAQQECE